jgi:hypothetical protein
MKKIDDYIEKKVNEWGEKNKEKFLKMGSVDACQKWFVRKVVIGLFLFFTIVFNRAETMEEFIAINIVNALLAWGVSYGTMFMVNYNDKKEGGNDDV